MSKLITSLILLALIFSLIFFTAFSNAKKPTREESEEEAIERRKEEKMRRRRERQAKFPKPQSAFDMNTLRESMESKRTENEKMIELLKKQGVNTEGIKLDDGSVYEKMMKAQAGYEEQEE